MGEGSGRGWGKGGQFTSNLRPRWTDPVTARRVPSKWRGIEGEAMGSKGEARGASKGRGKTRGMHHVHCNLCLCI